MVEHIEDDAMDEAHGNLSWYHDRYQDAVKNVKSLEKQLDSKREHRCKAKSELHVLRKEVKGKGKQKETFASTTHEWCEWESASDSDIASRCSAKAQGRCGATIQGRRTFNLGE